MAKYHLKDMVKYKGRVYFIGGCSKRKDGTKYYLCSENGDVGNVAEEELSPYDKSPDAIGTDNKDGADYPWANETPEEREEKIENFFKFLEDIGKDDPPNAHYARLSPQPIEYMQQAMTPEQFQGFCLGNVLKYALRFGHKDRKDKEAKKIFNYAMWLVDSTEGKKIHL